MKFARRHCLHAAWALGVCTLTATAHAEGNTPKVLFQTTAGNFTVELYPEKAPKTVENFLQYVKDKHYNGTIFHRVIPNFMVQGGGFSPEMQQKATRPPVPLEVHSKLKIIPRHDCYGSYLGP